MVLSELTVADKWQTAQLSGCIVPSIQSAQITCKPPLHLSDQLVRLRQDQQPAEDGTEVTCNASTTKWSIG